MADFLSPFVAGSLAGMVGNLVGQPWDTVKVVMQNNAGQSLSSVQTARKIVTKNGVKALYRGTVPPLLAAAPVNAATFGGYEGSLRLMGTDKHSASPAQLYLAGCCGGGAMSFVLTPLDLIKCKLQTSSKDTYAGTTDCVKKVFRANGVRGLYAGFSSTFLREGPSFGLYFLVYEKVAEALNPQRLGIDTLLGVSAACFAGGLAGASTWTAVYPIDVVKTHIQTLPEHVSPSQKKFITAAKHLYGRHGARHFYRGVGVCAQRAFVVNAALLPIYEGVLQAIEATRTA